MLREDEWQRQANYGSAGRDQGVCVPEFLCMQKIKNNNKIKNILPHSEYCLCMLWKESTAGSEIIL